MIQTQLIKAALASSKLFIENELSVRIVALPDGEDPDSLIIKFGIDEFKKLIDEALPDLII